jgi:hypothetical protein
MVWKTQLKKMMRNSKVKSVLPFWAKTGLERGVGGIGSVSVSVNPEARGW